jgi:hypothetical protein
MATLRELREVCAAVTEAAPNHDCAEITLRFLVLFDRMLRHPHETAKWLAKYTKSKVTVQTKDRCTCPACGWGTFYVEATAPTRFPSFLTTDEALTRVYYRGRVLFSIKVWLF